MNLVRDFIVIMRPYSHHGNVIFQNTSVGVDIWDYLLRSYGTRLHLDVSYRSIERGSLIHL